jgi:protein TonB
MIAKKNKKANLERSRFAFFQIGLIVSGSLVLAAFEYSTVTAEEQKVVFNDYNQNILGSEIPVDFIQKDPEPPAPQPTLINLDNVDSLNVVQFLTNPGQTQTTTVTSIIVNEGWGDPNGGIAMTIAGPDPSDIVPVPDIEPSFPGGEGAMMNWVAANVTYPELCREMGIGGMVYTEFVVNTDGSICLVKNLQSPHDDLSKEAMRVVNKMPKWIPGEQAGKKVRVRFTLPINFVHNY